MPIDKSIDYSAVTPEIETLARRYLTDHAIRPEMYVKYAVNRGLRDLNGNGVLTGLTEISEIQSSKMVDGEKVPCEGKLYYRGVDVEKIVAGFITEKRYGFEETVYLLLFGELPGAAQLADFQRLLAGYRSLPTNFVRDVILKAPNADMMNTLARSVLTLYSYDAHATDNSIENVLRQSLQMIALFPLLSVYGYQAYSHYVLDQSLYIHNPVPELSTAENLLHILRADGQYTELEARILDLALVLHAEHGGGNNSTFTMHVVTSSGTDTYSAVAAALASLKGPKHGGANLKVVQMFEDMKRTLPDWTDEAAIEQYLRALLHKEAFDRAGLIYGMGHAVYSLSDPRANVFQHFVELLAKEKGRCEEYALYAAVARLAPRIIGEERRIYKGVSPNIDFYSGFVYSMLDLPLELYTPIFAVSRIAGWSAHRIEELVNAGKIIRPSYKSVKKRVEYVPLGERG
jgi:citrate synthase